MPINVTTYSMCHISPRSAEGQHVKMEKLIVWDEASMTSRDILETVDRNFRDIMRNSEQYSGEFPFGGKLMVFGGDFRQNLLVIFHGNRNDVVPLCINRSFLWNSVNIMVLKMNMRVFQAVNTNNNSLAEVLEAFSNKFLDIGDGNVPYKSIFDHRRNVTVTTDLIKIDDSMVIPGNNLENLLQQIYPELYTSLPSINDTNFVNSAILTTKNKDVSTVNTISLNRFPGDVIVYLSADRVTDDNQELSIPAKF